MEMVYVTSHSIVREVSVCLNTCLRTKKCHIIKPLCHNQGTINCKHTLCLLLQYFTFLQSFYLLWVLSLAFLPFSYFSSYFYTCGNQEEFNNFHNFGHNLLTWWDISGGKKNNNNGSIWVYNFITHKLFCRQVMTKS